MGNDKRVGDFLAQSCSVVQVVILGFPSDEGVKRNGGRPGAANGPQAIREQLYRLCPDSANSERMEQLLKATKDLGDVEVSGDVESDQEKLGKVVGEHLSAGRRVIVLGGGHETSFGHYLGWHNIQRKVHVVNFDAHPDVRPLKQSKAHSGSPFRQKMDIENTMVSKYSVFGLNRFSVANEHIKYLEGRQCRFRYCEEVHKTDLGELYVHDTMLSLDLGVINQAYAPGVSAPNPSGLHPSFLYRAAEQAGKSGKVHSLDVVELNPRFDRDHQTAKIAAVIIWHYLAGLASASV